MFLRNIIFTGLAAMCFGACSVAPAGQGDHDPYEQINRQVHGFNKSLDARLFRSADQTPRQVPEEISKPVTNFADNVGLPGMVLNGLLQVDIAGAATNTMRFILNTTVGIGGLLDPAGAIGLAEQETDFGETLAVWGVPEGGYLELPLLGPSTERALAGRLVDMVIDPLDRFGMAQQVDYGTATRIASKILKRRQAAGTLDSVLGDSADSYTQLRLIYLQNRRFELGTTPAQDAVDPYDELFGE